MSKIPPGRGRVGLRGGVRGGKNLAPGKGQQGGKFSPKPGTSKVSLTPSEIARQNEEAANKQKEDNEYFEMNALLVSSLLPLIPTDERESVQKWMKKLYKMSSSATERGIRNDYVWFLLVQLESGTVTLPFVRDPPDGNLGPVNKAITKDLYEQILEAANNRSAFMDDLASPPRDTSLNATGESENVQFCLPSEFHELQPKPNMGFIVYGSCFSDQVN